MTPLRALIVEDSEFDTELLLRHLQAGGYDITHRRVQTADQMRAALAEETWQIVMSDFSMPGFSGLAALDILKGISPDIPFIIVSGTIGEDSAVQAMKNGAQDFFVKGRLTRLLTAVENELRHAGARIALKETARAREEFLSIAAHELRTPTTALVLQMESALRLLRSGGDAQLLVETLQTKLVVASRQVDRLVVLIEALLNFSRVTTGRLSIAPTALDFGKLIERVAGHLEGVLGQSQSTLTFRTDSGVMGSWDPIWLEVVVSNLLTNAAKFGAGKPIEVVLDSEGDMARLVVTDHGIGIAAVDQCRLFERFERAVSARNFGGFGLGLWLTKQIVETHGGSILVSSAEGAGSAFTVLLPRHPPGSEN